MNITAAQEARTNAILDRCVRIDGRITTWREFVSGVTASDLDTCDGMIDYSRTRFNRMNNREQSAYIAALKAKTYYMVRGVIVPKLVYEHAKRETL